MYEFERRKWGSVLFIKHNGIPISIGGRRVSKHSIVWWMPLNWVMMLYLILMAPLTLSLEYFKRK